MSQSFNICLCFHLFSYNISLQNVRASNNDKATLQDVVEEIKLEIEVKNQKMLKVKMLHEYLYYSSVFDASE